MRYLVVTILILLGAGAAAQAAEARTGFCLPPAQAQICNVWSGKVTFVGDGDTVYVDIAGDGRTSSVPVRLTGINTTEQTVYSSIAASGGASAIRSRRPRGSSSCFGPTASGCGCTRSTPRAPRGGG